LKRTIIIKSSCKRWFNLIEIIIMLSFENCNNKIRVIAVIAATTLSGYIYSAYAGTEAEPLQVVVEDNSAIKAEFDQTFNKMLDNPADVDLTMHYANLAIQLENYEAAIPPLERILLFNPNLPRVKQELGVLYYKLNSFEMAKSYLLDAKKSKDVPADVVARADEYLGKIK
jgi:tetratricopeptide (TPR) repeat protein